MLLGWILHMGLECIQALWPSSCQHSIVLYVHFYINKQHLVLCWWLNLQTVYTVPKEIHFPRYNMKCSRDKGILGGIVHVVSCFPLHFMLYRGNFDYFSDSVVGLFTLLYSSLNIVSLLQRKFIFLTKNKSYLHKVSYGFIKLEISVPVRSRMLSNLVHAWLALGMGDHSSGCCCKKIQ